MTYIITLEIEVEAPSKIEAVRKAEESYWDLYPNAQVKEIRAKKRND